MKKLFVSILLLVLCLVASCSKEVKYEIVDENIAQYSTGIGDNTLFVQYYTLDSYISEHDNNKYLRLEAKFNEKNYNHNSSTLYFTYYLNKMTKKNVINSKYEKYDDYTLLYSEIKLTDESYYIYDVGYYDPIPSDYEKVYDLIFIPSKDDTSKFFKHENVNYNFRKNFKWNVNKVKDNDNAYYMLYVDIITDYKFDKDFSIELKDTSDNFIYPQIQYTNNKKRMYVLLDNTKQYSRVNLNYEFIEYTLMYSLDIPSYEKYN